MKLDNVGRKHVDVNNLVIFEMHRKLHRKKDKKKLIGFRLDDSKGNLKVWQQTLPVLNF